MKSFVIELESETARLAKELAKLLRPGDCVGLSGDLGAGKTTFVRYLVDAMGGRTEEVSSPSYTLEHDYTLPSGVSLEHWDLYRLRETPDELKEPPGRDVIRLLEWPERCPGILDSVTLRCIFTVRPDGSRLAEVSALDDPARLAPLVVDTVRD